MSNKNLGLELTLRGNKLVPVGSSKNVFQMLGLTPKNREVYIPAHVVRKILRLAVPKRPPLPPPEVFNGNGNAFNLEQERNRLRQERNMEEWERGVRNLRSVSKNWRTTVNNKLKNDAISRHAEVIWRKNVQYPGLWAKANNATKKSFLSHFGINQAKIGAYRTIFNNKARKYIENREKRKENNRAFYNFSVQWNKNHELKWGRRKYYELKK
jgi:hypothetical protein